MTSQKEKRKKERKQTTQGKKTDYLIASFSFAWPSTSAAILESRRACSPLRPLRPPPLPRPCGCRSRAALPFPRAGVHLFHALPARLLLHRADAPARHGRSLTPPFAACSCGPAPSPAPSPRAPPRPSSRSGDAVTTRRAAVAGAFTTAFAAASPALAANPIWKPYPRKQGLASDVPKSVQKGCKVDKPCSKGAAFPLSDTDAGARYAYHIKAK